MSGIRQTTRVVEEIDPDDLLQCRVCDQWLPADANFGRRKAEPRGQRERYLLYCRPHVTMRNRMRVNGRQPVLAEARRAAKAGLSPTSVTLKGAGHKRGSTPRKPQTEREKQAWKVIREERKKRSGSGYIYLIAERPDIEWSADDAVKVGFSDDPEGRPAGLQTGNPRKLHLLGHIPGTEADERKLHARFIKQNILGEWFRPTDELLSVFGLKRGA